MPSARTESPQLHLSHLEDSHDDQPYYSISQPKLASRRRSKTESAVNARCKRTSTSEWVDVDNAAQPRRRSKQASRLHADNPHRSSRDQTRERSPDSDTGRYQPRLGQITEGAETRLGEHSTRSSISRTNGARSSTSHGRRRDDLSLQRRPVRHRARPLSSRTETILRVSPSLVSVLSTLTGISENSSSSNNTITQQIYDQAHGVDPSITANRRHRSVTHPVPDTSSTMNVNVFDYMDSSQDEHDLDHHAEDSSSASSNYEASDGGSSEVPGTPSTQSTFPSPANTRSGSVSGGSVADLRRKYDQYAVSSAGTRMTSPASSQRGRRKQPSVSDVAEDDEIQDTQSEMAPEVDLDEHRRPSSRSSQGSGMSAKHFQHQQELPHQSRPQFHHDHLADSRHEGYRSRSASSAGSIQSQHPVAHSMALQRLRYHQTAPAAPPSSTPSHIQDMQHEEAPPYAPDPPDLSRKSILGYEKLALELANARSSVQPLYRKFDYLNHRVLLHLQDEISELEEQLRHFDQLIAQYSHPIEGGVPVPASRRGEEYFGNDMHHERKILLGRIFLKIEQYNRAMSAYGSLNLDSRPADAGQIAKYRAWMQQHAPIHEGEAAFLLCEEDLISPNQRQAPQKLLPLPATPSASLLSWLPAVVLLLPLLLIASIPTVSARLAVTTLMALAGGTLAAFTQLGTLMPIRDWLLCAATYVMLMVAVAGFIPQHEA